MNVWVKNFPDKLVTMGDGQTLLLPHPDGGTWILSGLAINHWDINIETPVQDVSSFDSPVRDRGLQREITGTIGFIANGCEYTNQEMDSGPIVKEYSIRDLLQIVREKIQER